MKREQKIYQANSLFEITQIENKIITDAVEKAKGDKMDATDNVLVEKSFRLFDAKWYDLKYKGERILEVTLISNNGKYIIEVK